MPATYDGFLNAIQSPSQSASSTTGMTREDFLKKYGNTFVANDKGGNAASEVAGQDVGQYYDRYIGPNAQKQGLDDNGNNTVPLWMSSANKYTNSAQANDADGWTAYDYVDPHPESNDLGGLGEFWKAVGRPIATGAAMYGGITGLGGLMGGEAVGATGASLGTLPEGVVGSSFGSGVGGDLLASTPGFEAALSGGELGSSAIGSSLGGAGGGLLDTLKGAGSWLTSKDSLGGLISPLKGLSSLYDMYASNQKSNALSDRYNQVNSAINSYGAPGSPEYEAMKQELARKDAASGRNSQYGPRSVDLAARMAQPKLQALTALNGGQNQLLTQQQNQQYSGLNSLFANLGQTEGNNSISDSLSNWFKTQQQRTGG